MAFIQRYDDDTMRKMIPLMKLEKTNVYNCVCKWCQVDKKCHKNPRPISFSCVMWCDNKKLADYSFKDFLSLYVVNSAKSSGVCAWWRKSHNFSTLGMMEEHTSLIIGGNFHHFVKKNNGRNGGELGIHLPNWPSLRAICMIYHFKDLLEQILRNSVFMWAWLIYFT